MESTSAWEAARRNPQGEPPALGQGQESAYLFVCSLRSESHCLRPSLRCWCIFNGQCGVPAVCQVAFWALAILQVQPQVPLSRPFLLLLFVFLFYFYLFIYFFFVFLLFLWAVPKAYGGSQARGLIGAIATGLHHSQSNTGSEPCL